jgi:N-dimethylarginine dimethylaminohydrolase
MYHLDLGMSEELPHGEVMMSTAVTDPETFEKIRAIVGSRNIIPLSYNEAVKFATNMIDIGDTLVMSGNCPALHDDLIDRGYQVIMPADYGREKFEFGQGGVHCMTNDVQQPARGRHRKALKLSI